MSDGTVQSAVNMKFKDRTIIGHCVEDIAKKTALLFDGVSIIVDWDRMHSLNDELDIYEPDFITIIGLKSSLSQPTQISNETLWATANGASGRGIECVPVYSTKTAFENEFDRKEHKIYRVILENIPVVDESKLSWKQVEEVRKDPKLLKGFRALRIWLGSIDKDMTVSEFQDLLEQKIDSYQDALKIHGLSSINGALSVFIDPTKIATLSGVVIGAGLAGGELAAALSGGVLVATQVVAKVNDFLIGRNQVNKNYAEVAVLQEIAKSVANKRINRTKIGPALPT